MQVKSRRLSLQPRRSRDTGGGPVGSAAAFVTVDYDLLTKDYSGHPPINHRFLC